MTLKGYSESVNRQTTQWPKYKRAKGQTTIRTPLKTGMNSGAPEGKAVPVPQVAPVVLL